MALKTVLLSDRLSSALGPFFALGGAAVLVIGWGWWYDDIIKSPTRSNSFFLFFIFSAGSQGFKIFFQVAPREKFTFHQSNQVSLPLQPNVQRTNHLLRIHHSSKRLCRPVPSSVPNCDTMMIQEFVSPTTFLLHAGHIHLQKIFCNISFCVLPLPS